MTLLLTPLGCTSSSGYGGTATSTGTTLPNCDGVAASSTVVLGHSHDVCVPAADLTSPPADGAVYTTTFSGDGHVHTVALSQAQLTAVASGQTIVVTTSTTESHAHVYSLLQTAVPMPTAPPGGGSTGGYYGY